LGIQVGYAGGKSAEVTYNQVCSGSTGHAEVVQIKFDPKTLKYETLVDFFYRMHEPTEANRQGNDRGSQYRSSIFYHNDTQKKLAEEGTAIAQVSYGGKIKTTIEKMDVYVAGELHHQDYLTNNQGGYECNYSLLF
jgi:peptide-methionine (S)-S-oxide reductase